MSACAADGLYDLRRRLVEPARERGWRVTVTLTPAAAGWLAAAGEVERLAEVTGYPVRHGSRLPTEPRPHPVADCHLVAPASANTVAKLALGVSDNQVLSQVNEAIGTPEVPVVLLASVNSTHVRHPAWAAHTATLRLAGVRLLTAPGLPAGPRQDRPPLPWRAALDAVSAGSTSAR